MSYPINVPSHPSSDSLSLELDDLQEQPVRERSSATAIDDEIDSAHESDPLTPYTI